MLQANRVTPPARVLAISPLECDQIALRRMFDCSHWTLDIANSIREALEFARTNEVPVVICNESLPDGGWKDALQEFAQLPRAPRMIVAAPLPGDRLWVDVLDLGAFDVLPKPFEPKTLFPSVSLAWRSTAGQWPARYSAPRVQEPAMASAATNK